MRSQVALEYKPFKSLQFSLNVLDSKIELSALCLIFIVVRRHLFIGINFQSFTIPLYGGDVLQLLKRRFKSFVGVSNGNEISIESGINRLNLPREFNKSEIHLFNNEIIAKAGARDMLKQIWSDALSKGVALTEEINVPFPEGKEIGCKRDKYPLAELALAVSEIKGKQ